MAAPKKEKNPRADWKKGSDVEVYGSKSGKWYSGKIAGIDEDDDGEWLKVTYKTDKKELMMRKVQRYSDQVRPIGGDDKYQKIDNDESKKDDDNKETQKNQKVRKLLNKAKEEIVYPADKYLEEAEKEVIESHEKGDAKTTIGLLKKLNCKVWDLSLFDDDNQKEVAYVCNDGYMLHAEIIRVNKAKTKIFVHLGNDYRHYDFNLKQKSIWIDIPNDRIYSIDALQKFKNPKANEKKKNDDEIPNDALEFFKQSSGMSAGQLERHESIQSNTDK